MADEVKAPTPATANPSASATAKKPNGEGEFIDDQVVLKIHQSVWHKPLWFLLCLLATFGPLIGLAFVYENSTWLMVFLVLAGIGLINLVIYLFTTKIGATYTVTERRCTSTTGFISRTITEVEISHIRSIEVRQTIPQRLVGIGDVEISTSGSDGFEVAFLSVRDPLGVRRIIMDRK